MECFKVSAAVQLDKSPPELDMTAFNTTVHLHSTLGLQVAVAVVSM